MVMNHRLQRGYTYLTLLFAVAFMGAGLATASSLWHTAQMREKERELLYVGDQYKKAIKAYYEQGKTYPRELVQLLRDQRVQGVRRYLRKLYRDPMTGKAEWGLVKTPDGGIAGVYSLSEETPFKQAEFPKDYAEFTGKTKYSDWKFAYLQQGAQQKTPASSPGGAPQQGTAGAAGSAGGAGVLSAPGTQTPASPGGGGVFSAPGTQAPASPGSAPAQNTPGTGGGTSTFGVPGGASSQTNPGGVAGVPQPPAPRR
jgi:type II secretory pathway pseudopilin PulG